MEQEFPHLTVLTLSLLLSTSVLLWSTRQRIAQLSGRYAPSEEALQRVAACMGVGALGVGALIDWAALKDALMPLLAGVALVSGIVLPEVISAVVFLRLEDSTHTDAPAAIAHQVAVPPAVPGPLSAEPGVLYVDQTPRPRQPSPREVANLLAEAHRTAKALNARTQSALLMAQHHQQTLRANLEER